MLLVKGFGNDVYLFPFPSMNVTTLSVCPPKTAAVTIEVSKDFENQESNHLHMHNIVDSVGFWRFLCVNSLRQSFYSSILPVTMAKTVYFPIYRKS
jgi:hypothetical protein